MTKTMARSLSAGLLCMALWPATVLAQSDPLRDAFNQFNALYEQGRYDEAEPFTRKAVKLGIEKFGPHYPTTAVFINDLALLYHAQRKYAEAEPLFKRALTIREQALGPGHPDVGQSLNNLAELYRAQGEYAEAEPLLKRALAVVEKALGPGAPERGRQPQQPGGAL